MDNTDILAEFSMQFSSKREKKNPPPTLSGKGRQLSKPICFILNGLKLGVLFYLCIYSCTN